MDHASFAIVAFCVGLAASSYLAERGIKGGIKDLQGQPDPIEASARQSRQDIAGIVWLLTLTNGLLAGILAVLVYPLL